MGFILPDWCLVPVQPFGPVFKIIHVPSQFNQRLQIDGVQVIVSSNGILFRDIMVIILTPPSTHRCLPISINS